MNHSIIICDSESYANIGKNNDKFFVFNNTSESNNTLIYNVIVNKKQVNRNSYLLVQK